MLPKQLFSPLQQIIEIIVLHNIPNLRTSDDSLFDFGFPEENKGKFSLMLAINISFTVFFLKYQLAICF
jgi:hypothetical protein